MKKIFRYAAMICAAALAVACAEEPQDEPIVEHPTTKDLTITTEATTPDSRVLFADGEGFAWENADLTKMAVCYNEELLWKHTCSTSGAINEGIASFTATVNAESVFAYCYYPTLRITRPTQLLPTTSLPTLLRARQVKLPLCVWLRMLSASRARLTMLPLSSAS